ncbi:hypothetical protein [Thauera linaloolentis]|uniref:Thiosulfate reductase n=1 Tax=Thauera linaloolentis (strain DSM 12138 / JCM 21573 / CCUG 41526 / CIP 105981 / IAM 15112 / NBRC 102519 / 47Lol) TaxID=1123367 RepID=N6Z2U1_THAL4|nr:hypothetical protein [Thauera linaloolentis]ENO88897.1 hypothetical protein C666_07765 [Thauera linaloolentis 47Lol = DSM 12138]MCM8564808.1 hypothetical protein [Thauera linaloolentis]
MSEIRKLDLAWLGLVLLSVGGAALGGRPDAGLGVTALVALVMGIKVRIVCDHYLELPTATRRIRRAMYAFCYGMPIVVILTSAFGDTLARLTGALI